KLKEAFCLILQYSQEEEDGISTQYLSEKVWPDNLPHKVKNTRNVTLNRLRNILKELDGIELIFEKGFFKHSLKKPIYCDYTKCMQILSTSKDEIELNEFIKIVT